jgi:hypothetical protein
MRALRTNGLASEPMSFIIAICLFLNPAKV